jgi:putative redox protein
MATINLVVKQTGVSSSEANARGHKLVMDRPEEKGGVNAGMMGGEALLGGLGGCFMSNLLAAAVTRNIKLTEAKAEISAEMENAPSRFTVVTMTVSAQYPEGTDFQKLVTIAERSCISANTLKKAVELNILLRKNPA